MNLRLTVIVPVYQRGLMTWHPDRSRNKPLPAGSPEAKERNKRLAEVRSYANPGTRVRVLQTWTCDDTDGTHTYWEIEVIEGPALGYTCWVDEDEAEPIPALEQLAECADETL